MTTVRNPRSPLSPRWPPPALGWVICVLCVLGSLLGLTGRAHAQARQFQEARDAYERGEYARVVELLEPLVGGEVPVISDRILLRECRKYLGAAYVVTGDPERGREQFDALLRAEREDFDRYRLDPAAFSSEVHRVFGEARAVLVRQREEDQAALDAQRRDRADQRRAAMLTLVEMAQEPVVDVPNDPLLAWMPFGVGQVQNGNGDLGLFFGISELVSLAGNLALGGLSYQLGLQYDASWRYEALEVSESLLVGLQVANLVLGGVFVVLVAAGIIEAHVNFVPSRPRRQQRTLPPEILQRIELVGSPSGFGLRF